MEKQSKLDLDLHHGELWSIFEVLSVKEKFFNHIIIFITAYTNIEKEFIMRNSSERF